MSNKVHAFNHTDVLGTEDATGIGELIRSKQASVKEVATAAIARIESVEEQLHGVQIADYQRALDTAQEMDDKGLPDGVFAGVPTMIKDNTNYRGLPTNHGSLAVNAQPATEHNAFAKQFLSTGFIPLGKSTMPEFGFSASTEPGHTRATANPWNTDYSCGASSGGSAALTAAGALPIAHANDGGGSIRIPAACCGLVGFKPSRDRLVNAEHTHALPINIISEGVVTRSVRDTANFMMQAEKYYKNSHLPPIGELGINRRKLRIGLIVHASADKPTDEATEQKLRQVATTLQDLGHSVSETTLSFDPKAAADFLDYWSLLAFFIQRRGQKVIDPSFEQEKLDMFTIGLAKRFKSRFWRTPLFIRSLRKGEQTYKELFNNTDVFLMPTLCHQTPKLGYLSHQQSYDQLLDKLEKYVGFTPIHNVTGAPAISLPLAQSQRDLPIGIQLCSQVGDDKTLLELAFELEQAMPFAKIYQ